MKKTVVTLITAAKLSPTQKKDVVAELEQKLGPIEIEHIIDPTVMGGLKIKLGSQEFDATVAGKLEKLEKQIPEVQVTTAIELTAEQRKKIKAAVEAKFGPSTLVEAVDPSIIGGIKIVTGSRELDGTIKGKLNRLRNQILQTI